MPVASSRSQIIAKPKRHKLARVITLVSMFSISPLLGSFSKGPPQPMHTSELSGREYLKEVLNCKNPRRCPEVLGMKVEVFQFLCLELQRKGKLCASKHVDVDEQVGMFLWTVVKAASNREVQERFQRSGDTVSRHFHQVLKAITFLIPEWIMLPIKPITIADTVSSNSKFYPYFNDCIGALDGTHIAAKVSEEVAPAYRNRKGWISQNVLACCELDNLLFTYVLAGWEGSAHDGSVLEAAFDTGFHIPAGKFYLADAGYALTPWCITPYRGVRYHLREWEKSNLRYQCKLEALY